MHKFIFILFLNICATFANAQSVSFTYTSSGAICNPATINFIATTSEVPIGLTWYFGNGQISNLSSPSTSYTIAGTYTIKLVAVFTNNVVETSQTIIVNPSITNTLTVDRSYICTPGNVSFTAASSGTITSFEWNFGDGITTTTTAPSITHAYTNFGVYTATVKATDAAGCFANATQTITVQNPPITGTVSPTSGCIPANTSFTANVTLPTGGSVTSYTWDYNDGSSTSNSNTHTYTAVGSYTPIVAIVTNEGCTNTFNYSAINFGTPPTNHVASSDKLIYCGSETPIFTATATNANAYTWDFGDGTISTVTTNTTTHRYTTLGVKNILVTPYFNGCAGTAINFSITIVGVIASYNYANTCSNKKTFSFTNTSLGNISNSIWKFGDGTLQLNSFNATHTFPTSGAFVTWLVVTDNITGCVDSISRTIYTANPSISNPDVFLCRNNNSTFTVSNPYNINAASIYSWNVLGLSTSINQTSITTFSASNFGNFSNNNVIINNGSQYCSDTIFLNQTISVRGPNLSFTVPTTAVCAPAIVNIVNTSTAYLATDTVMLWSWNYGIVGTNDTIYQPPTQNFTAVGFYNIKLIAKDKNGCVDSLTKIVTANPSPFLRVFPRLDTLCLGQSGTFVAFHSDTLLWSPSALLSCVTCDTTIANPTSSSFIFATAKNIYNCTTIDSAFIIVQTPFTPSAILSPIYICKNDSTQINVTPPNKKISWLPTTNISNANAYNPFVYPTSNTSYVATLTDSANCFTSTATVNIIVKSLPQVNAGPDLALPYNVDFVINPTYSANVSSYNWTPATNLSCSICAAPTVTPIDAQQYIITVKSDSNCVAKDTINIIVECKYAYLLMPSAFTPNGDNINEYYFPITRGIKTISKFIIYNRLGQKVFEAKDFAPNNNTFGWNGKIKGEPVTTSSYVYLLSAICFDGQVLEKKGSFILIK
jgi:gliding motility-associated-like protein